MIRRVVTFVAVGVLIVSGGPLRAGERAPAQAPVLELRNLYGQPVTVDYAGHAATLINLWATWCLPCHDEMPQIADLVDTYKARGFRAVGITVESGSAEEIRSFLAESPELGINYDIVVGDDATLRKLGDVEIVPMSFLVDAKGTIVKTYVGVDPDFKEKLAADIESVIAGGGGKGGDRSGEEPAPPAKAGAGGGQGD